MTDAKDSGMNTAILKDRNRMVTYALQTLGGILLTIIGFIAKDAYVTGQELRQEVTALKVRQDADERDKTTLRAEMREGFQDLKRGLEKLTDKLDKSQGHP